MEKYIKALEGISYSDWKKLRRIINIVFQNKGREVSDRITLSSDDKAKVTIEGEYNSTHGYCHSKSYDFPDGVSR